jgi:hypothetical protein
MRRPLKRILLKMDGRASGSISCRGHSGRLTEAQNSQHWLVMFMLLLQPPH